MSDRAKMATLNRVTKEGYTDSYGTLLCLTAVMGSDPDALGPMGAEERAEWRGHFKGLRAALLSLAMHERRLDPEAAVQVVGQHLEDAMSDLKQGNDTGTEE
jgi:hypothetical protein